MRAFVLAVLALAIVVVPELARASPPCDGVDRTLSPIQATLLSRAIADDLGVDKVKVLKTFKLEGWSIVSIEAPKADDAFVFYSKEPGTARHVTLWSGAARKDEEAEITRWAQANAPGIPARLAKCFAWHVTNGRNL